MHAKILHTAAVLLQSKNRKQELLIRKCHGIDAQLSWLTKSHSSATLVSQLQQVLHILQRRMYLWVTHGPHVLVATTAIPCVLVEA